MATVPPAAATGSLPSKIHRLDEAVVNRIAAGEVVQRPANAIKEMMENSDLFNVIHSLDAGSSSVQVVVKTGGLKLIQIQDNGSGIRKEDMMIVCERFTTSKLRKFEDLSNISTYGFRGEALASISHVAHVTITTKTGDSKCAYKASYADGKILPAKPGGVAQPRPCAGNQGTLISAEDLFYNMPTRKRALKAAEEYNRIADVITKYAVHNSGVALTLKKQQGESVADVRTQQSSSLTENISTLYGASVGRELLPVLCQNSRLGFKMSGHITNANYSVKKFQFILFINHRLVESVSIRKAIECVYAAYLPKHTHPFVYMSIEIAPANIDVNVHPTKHEVHFLHEDVVVESIQRAVEDALLGCNVSRTYYTKTLLPTPVTLETTNKGSNPEKPSYAYQMVRTDSKEQKLDAFVVPRSLQTQLSYPPPHPLPPPAPRTPLSSSSSLPPTPPPPPIPRPPLLGQSAAQCERDSREGDMEYLETRKSTDQRKEGGGSKCEGVVEERGMEEEEEGGGGEVQMGAEAMSRSSSCEVDLTSAGLSRKRKDEEERDGALSSSSGSNASLTPLGSTRSSTTSLMERFSRKRSKRREVNLTSVLNLQRAIRTNQHRDLTDLFQNHKFVGCVDQTRSLVQHQTKLYLVDISKITKELFYQLVVFGFANFGTLKLTPPAPIFDLVLLALELPESEWTEEHGPKEKIAQYVVNLMKEKAEMLKDYFSIDIREDGLLYALPLLLDSYSPNLDRLPLFILRLATEVDWEEEKACFQTIATELGWFYGLQHDPFLLDSSEVETRGTVDEEDRGGEKGEEGGGGGGVPKHLYKKQPWRWTVEHVIFPALRSHLVAQKKMATDGSLLQIADLHDLYKVFERC